MKVRSRGHELGQKGEVWQGRVVEFDVEAGLDGRVVEGGGEVAVEVVDVGWEDTLVDTEV